MAMDATFTAEEQFRRGRALLAEARDPEALECFRSAHQIDRANPRYRSFYGLGLALVERRFEKALELCRSGAKEEFFNPELYHNLARVHMAFGFKSEAIRYLRRGLMIDPANQALATDLERLGRRRMPVLQFLPRNHPVNRWLGRMRTRFGGMGAEPDAAGAAAQS
jgi:tetratricopeptide (TPR) repeat protein